MPSSRASASRRHPQDRRPRGRTGWPESVRRSSRRWTSSRAPGRRDREFVEGRDGASGVFWREQRPGAQPDGPSGNQEEQPSDDRDERLEAHTAAGRARLRHLATILGCSVSNPRSPAGLPIGQAWCGAGATARLVSAHYARSYSTGLQTMTLPSELTKLPSWRSVMRSPPPGPSQVVAQVSAGHLASLVLVAELTADGSGREHHAVDVHVEGTRIMADRFDQLRVDTLHAAARRVRTAERAAE